MKDPYVPVTLQDPQTGVTHTANDYLHTDCMTLCGLDAGAWAGWSEDDPTCPTCLEKLAALSDEYEVYTE